MKTNKAKWTNIADLTKRSIKAGLYVSTPKTVTDFYKDGDRQRVNITNWNSENQTHVYYKLDYSPITDWLFIEMRDTRTDELLQSNTFTTVKELKDYLKTL